MTDPFRQKLREIIAKFGPALGDDAEHCETVLRTMAGAYEAEITVLMAAVAEKVPANLQTWQSRLPPPKLIPWLANSLAHKRGLDKTLALWAVESWAVALDLIAFEDLSLAFPAQPASLENPSVPESPPTIAPDPAPANEPDTKTNTGKPVWPTPPSAVKRHKSRILSRRSYTSSLSTPALVLTLTADLPMEFVRVPPGEFLMGSDKAKDRLASEDEAPQHVVRLGEYLIGRHPVTNAHYAVFVSETSARPPDHWPEGLIPPALERHPVVNVSWDDALAFCRWLSEKSQQIIRLPNEAEWEKAARGLEGLTWPWNNEPPDAMRCNFDKLAGATTPVGQYSPAGDSPFWCTDMAGNVWEWTASLYKPYPFQPEAERQDLRSRGPRVARGGAWDSGAEATRTTRRARGDPAARLYTRGFRCAR